MSEADKLNIGRVLWFDQKKGFGYINVINPESEYNGKDIFVHFSSIQSESSFKKLYPGEYVSFEVVFDNEAPEGKKYTSKDVTGVYKNLLLVDNKEYRYRLIRIKDN